MAEDYTRDVTIRVTETGAAGATAALNKTTQAADKLQAETKTLGTRLVESKEQFSAVGGAAFAATSALQSASGGVTQLLSGLGAVTGALSAVPGPLGAVSAGMTALLGVGASVSALFEDTGEAAAAAAAKVDALRKSYTDFQGQLGKGFSLQAAERLAGLQTEATKVADRRASLIKEIDEASRFADDLNKRREEWDREARMADAAEGARRATTLAAISRAISDKEVQRGSMASPEAIRTYASQRKEELRRQFDQLAKVERDLQTEIDAVTRAEQFRLAAPRAMLEGKESAGAKREAESEGFTGSFSFAAIKARYLEEIYWRKLAHDDYLKTLDEQDQRDQAKWALERDRIAARRAMWKAEGDERRRLAREEMRELRESREALVDKGQAYFNAAFAAGVAGESVGAAIKKQLAAEAAAAAMEASWNTLKYGALALGALAMGNAPAAAAYGKAAALWAGVGVVAGGIAAASGGFSAGGGGGGLSAGSSAAENLRQPEREETSAPVTINVYTGQALATRGQIVDAVAEAWVEGTRRRGSPIHGFMGGR